MTYTPTARLHRQFVLDPPDAPRQIEQYKSISHPLYCQSFTHPQSVHEAQLLDGTPYSELSRFRQYQPSLLAYISTLGRCLTFPPVWDVSPINTLSIFSCIEGKIKYYWRLLNHLFSRISYADISSQMALSEPPTIHPDANTSCIARDFREDKVKANQSLAEYSQDPLGFMTRCAREFGEIVPLRFEGQYCLLTNPDHITEVLTDRLLFIKAEDTRLLRGLLGNGLITSEGEFWQRQRRLINPVFHQQRINSYGAVMVDYTQRMLQTWHEGKVLDVLKREQGAGSRESPGLKAGDLMGGRLVCRASPRPTSLFFAFPCLKTTA